MNEISKKELERKVNSKEYIERMTVNVYNDMLGAFLEGLTDHDDLIDTIADEYANEYAYENDWDKYQGEERNDDIYDFFYDYFADIATKILAENINE